MVKEKLTNISACTSLPPPCYDDGRFVGHINLPSFCNACAYLNSSKSNKQLSLKIQHSKNPFEFKYFENSNKTFELVNKLLISIEHSNVCMTH